MPATEASSSPFILDLEMSEQIPQDIDLDFFNSNIPYASGPSPGNFLLSEEFIGENSSSSSSYERRTFGSPASPNLKHDLSSHPQYHEANSKELSAPSSVSPPGSSFHDSSSDTSGYKRKTSSDSSRSVLTGKGDIMMDDTDWKVEDMMSGGAPYRSYSGATIDPSTLESNFEFSDKAMEDSFDFNGASGANSPIHFASVPVDMDSPEMQPIKNDTPRKSSPKIKSRFGQHTKVNSQNSITQSMHGLTTGGSREASPLSAMVTSQDSSPAAWNPTHSPSPNGGPDFVTGAMLNNSMTSPWSTSYGHTGQPSHFNSLAPPSMMNNPSPLSSELSLFDAYTPLRLYIHPTPLKSRVETQIPIKMTLFPIPKGITKLHLPTHTISKPKLLSKPAPDRSPDMLELYTTLVCTSAMQNPEFRRRAFVRAAASAMTSDSSSSDGTGDESTDEDDESRPLNGGEVKICVGCITRERKRAARKKVKKIEEEESWHKDESKRVVVFNTHEVKEWLAPSGQVPSEATGDRVEPIVPEGAMQVDVPMRIACYCRHQNEKLGFQVIFTLKDYNDRLVAQEMSSSIMITDDHKTHNMPPLSTQASTGSDGQMFPTSGGIFTSDANFEMPPLGPFRNSHSSSDLQSLQRNYSLMYQPNTAGTATSSHTSQATSATMTPRNLSRQASPSGSSGPYAKKRKASGSNKVPSGLAMTKLDTSQPMINQNPGISSTTTTATTTPSPYTPSLGSFQIQHDIQFGQLAASMHQPIGSQFNTGSTTPNSHENPFAFGNRSHSMENLALQQMYSAPPSAHPSRAPSPNGMYQQQHHSQQLAQAIANVNSNGFYSVPAATVAPHRSPTIHKMIPNEGPKAGGIEVTCLGSGFFQGLEVMFGDTKATTTTFWGETSLVCLLPPATVPGLVLVTLKRQQQMQPYPTPPLPKQQVFFNYIDDDEQQIIRTALQVLGHKMTGKSEDIRELARRIIGDGPASWGAPTSHSPSGGTQHQQRLALNPATFGIDVEATLLRCLDLIDLDDSPRMPRLNLRRPSGQTMLHLACSLGLHRVVAALLARGANPDPRDKGGFTPMHFAAMHNYPQIVRRLMLCGADPTMRSLQGYTPADLSNTDEVLRATRRLEHHRRTRSGGSVRSRTSSATSLRSLWEPVSTMRFPTPPAEEISGSDEASQDEDEDEDDYVDEDNDDQSESAFWMRSRRASAHNIAIEPAEPVNNIELPIVPGGLALPTTAVTAFRDQLAAQIQHLHHTMHVNLPNLPQMPTLPMMPNLPDYQAYLPTAPMVRRISALVPQMGGSRPGTSDHPPKETDSRWWDLFSGTMPTAPPAYDDIFPQGDLDTKKASAVQAAADTVADNKCASLFDKTEIAGQSTSSTSTLLDTLRIGDSHLITREQQDQLRMAHAEKVKRLRSDRNLFFIWIPLLIIIIIAMLYNNLPQSWSDATQLVSTFAAKTHDRIVEVQ